MFSIVVTVHNFLSDLYVCIYVCVYGVCVCVRAVQHFSIISKQ